VKKCASRRREFGRWCRRNDALQRDTHLLPFVYAGESCAFFAMSPLCLLPPQRRCRCPSPRRPSTPNAAAFFEIPFSSERQRAAHPVRQQQRSTFNRPIYMSASTPVQSHSPLRWPQYTAARRQTVCPPSRAANVSAVSSATLCHRPRDGRFSRLRPILI